MRTLRALAFFCRPRCVLATAIPFHRDRTLGGIAVRFGGSEKVFPDLDPYGGLLFTLRVHLSRAPARSRGPVEGRLIFVIVFPQAFFLIKTEGPSRAMIFL